MSLAVFLGTHASLTPTDLDALRSAALLHDTGLTEGAAAAEVSPDPLTPDQLHAVRQHPLRASVQVGKVGNLLWVSRILETHHEHYNGWGYPFGLKGDEIPLPAAILGVAEAFLAMVTPRPYRRKVWTAAEAVEEIRSRSGEQFHPVAVAALVRAFEAGDLAGVLTPLDPEEAAPQVVHEAIGRLRALAQTPHLPQHGETAGAVVGTGADVWFRGTGGLRRFAQRLFSRDPLSVLRRERNRLADWYRSLYELSQVFSSSLDVDGIAGHLADAVHRLTTLPCQVSLVGGDGETLTSLAVRGLPAEALATAHRTTTRGLSGIAFTQQRPVTSLDVGRDERAANQETAIRLGLKSCLVLPLVAGGTSLGIVYIYSPTIRTFPVAEVGALTAVCNLAALGLENALLYQRANERLSTLVESLRLLRSTLDTVPVGIVAVGAGTGFLLTNGRAASYLEAFGLDAARDEPERILEGLRARLGTTVVSDVLERGRPLGPEMVSVTGLSGRRRGEPLEERFFEVSASPLEDVQGRTRGVMVILKDVTDEQRFEAEARRHEKLAAVGEVAAKAAHEIRNPLTSLLGFTQLLELYCPVRDQWSECSSYVGRIREEVERLDEIVQSMLVLARPARPTIADGDLARCVVETLQMLAPKAEEKGVALVGPGTDQAMPARFDHRQMRQVLMNLVQNAIDALTQAGGPPAGTRRVEVELVRGTRNRRRYIIVSVRDNGPGIHPADRANIFNAFYTTKDGGTGLGLPVSRGIVEAHGGTLTVKGVKGGSGAVFEICLPDTGAPRR